MPLGALSGNADARAALLRALASRRLPHALLLHGPRGIGKTEAAVALAEALLCPAADPDACGACNTCRRVARGIHPDLRRIERDGQFVRVEAAREMVRESHLKPFEGRAKVFLLPEAEALNDESANTLLKTLEEPPPSTYIVLVTSSREAVLPTIRSRCQALAFRPLARAELCQRLGGEQPAEAELRARLSGGDESLARGFDLARLRALRAELIALLSALARAALGPAQADRLVDLAESAARHGDALDELFLVVRSLARDALVLAAGGAGEIAVNADALEEVRALAQDLGREAASALLEDLEQAEADLRVNANRKLLVEAVLLGVYERACLERGGGGPTVARAGGARSGPQAQARPQLR